MYIEKQDFMFEFISFLYCDKVYAFQLEEVCPFPLLSKTMVK